MRGARQARAGLVVPEVQAVPAAPEVQVDWRALVVQEVPAGRQAQAERAARRPLPVA